MDGTAHTEVDTGYLDELISVKYGNNRENLIMILQDLNATYNYLPTEALKRVAKNLKLPLSRVYEVVTFYKAFSLIPRGKHIISLCIGTACHIRGTSHIKDRLEEYLGIEAGGTTEDMEFSLETVRCIGCCSLGPVVTLDGKTLARINPEEVIKNLEKYH